ncbi:DUF2628 domain-containing protein [Sulfurimonas sp. SAG-AH-194-C21]|nr:DUF2628 domain-containing protein [Sulfurimonas sp. SAG-AH-194-C21]MDF1883557.1 DUF2628 domain-containing protein [Sulfurimonas sp. SAG-AH-194-C21]
MPEEGSKEYTNAMIEAFIDTPEKTLWYQMSFSKFNVNGVDNMAWNWSWWAFFSGFLFLLYRKAYIPAFILLFLSLSVGMIPFVGLLLMILSGGYSSYFIYKIYKTKLHETQNIVKDEQTQLDTMRQLGGFNQWVIWVYAALVSIVFLLILIPLLAIL